MSTHTPSTEYAPRRAGKGKWLLLAAVLLIAGAVGGYSLKGSGAFYQMKVWLGLAKPLVEQTAKATGDVPLPPDERVDDNWNHPGLAFTQAMSSAPTDGYTCLKIGPDGALWASSDSGLFYRFELNADGTLKEPTLFTSLQDAQGRRLVTGFDFEPGTNPAEPAIWISNCFFAFEDVPAFSTKITRLSGPGLSVVEDKVINLPRSYKDHATNQPQFGPNGMLWIPQASNNAFGDADELWGNRINSLLNASLLTLDIGKLPATGPLDVKTKDSGGDYDPFAPDAPLAIHTQGIRLAYDMVFADNGYLYVPQNGSSSDGNVPKGPTSPAVRNVPDAESDFLHRIDPNTPGTYRGHPNPAAGHYVFNGGNPTAGQDVNELPQYPVGTMPDPKYVPPVLDLGVHMSANGIIQYQDAKAWGGKLKGCLIVCRYSFGRDLAVIRLNEDGTVAEYIRGTPGLFEQPDVMDTLQNPLDVCEGPDGILYVADYGVRGILILRPDNNAAITQSTTQPTTP